MDQPDPERGDLPTEADDRAQHHFLGPSATRDLFKYPVRAGVENAEVGLQGTALHRKAILSLAP